MVGLQISKSVVSRLKQRQKKNVLKEKKKEGQASVLNAANNQWKYTGGKAAGFGN